jgi:MFS family permease
MIPSNPAIRWALAGLALSMLLSSLGTSIANVALPSLAEAFDATLQEVQWVVLAYLLAITSSIVGAGKLGDLVGRRRLLRAGLLVFTVASVAASVAPALWLLIVARAAQGLGASVMMALTIALVNEIVPEAKTGSAMGLLGTTSAIGTALGPSLGGVLVDSLGWSSIFLINVPLGSLAVLLVHRHLPDDRPTPRAKPASFDGLGTLLLALTLAAYSLAMTHHVALLIAVVVGVVLFVLVERKAASPLIRPTMFRDPVLGASLVANAIASTVLMATLVVGPFYLSFALRLDPGLVGIVMSIGPIVAALAGVPAGRIVDRFGTPGMTVIGLGGIALGSILLSLLPEGLGIPGYVAPIVVITAAYALFQAANNTSVMRGVGPNQRGVVSGTLNLSRNLGLITGASLMGAVFALASSTNDLASAAPEDLAAGMRITFAVAAALIMLALALVVGGRVLARAPLRLMAWTLVLVLSPSVAAAQQPGDERGFVLRSPDGVNSLRVLGLFQPRLAHRWDDEAPDESAFSLNRARVGLRGTVFTKNLQYLVVADFGGGEPRLAFLHLDHTLVRDRLTLRVGQFKRPFSRSFITLASQMSMIDRPSTVGPSVFGDNTDIGLMLHNEGSGRFEYSVGVFNGTGPNVVPQHVHPLVAARVGWATAGSNPYGESDLEGGGPRFGIAAAALVDFDADGDDASFASGLVDVMFKASGFSLSSAVYVGTRQAGPRWSDQRLATLGHHTQLGWVVAKRFEPVVRYAFVRPMGEGREQHDVAGGLNLFFRGHAFKWQNSVSVRFQPGEGFAEPDVLLQSQLSVAF